MSAPTQMNGFRCLATGSVAPDRTLGPVRPVGCISGLGGRRAYADPRAGAFQSPNVNW
jgi:hypothetical protein